MPPTPPVPPAGAGGETPKNPGCAPSHQPPDASRWVYPSEQQLYNAMRRKGWNIPDETAVPFVLRIHNEVNERGWTEVRRWETELRGGGDQSGPSSPLRLVKFLGRPNDISPRAFFNSRVLMYRPPFDRHDWYVDHGEGTVARRYVIDFYDGNDGVSPTPAGAPSTDPRPPAMYLDVRPALDDPSAFVDRAHMFVRDAFPGLFAAFGRETGVGGDDAGSREAPAGPGRSS